MNILWITNIVFPEAQALLTGDRRFTSSGGWMLGEAQALLKQPDIVLYVATPSKSVNALRVLNGERITYYLFPLGKGNLKKNDEYRKYWRQIHDALNPDVVHIHGTEYSHGLAYVDECGADNVVVSIQGLTSEIAKYYSLGLTRWQILRNITIGDLFRGSVFGDIRRFRSRGEVEIELINKVHNIIGRTSFDRSHVWKLNPNAMYFFCNEILREEFYTGKWEYTSCVPYTIFFSQANDPLKGFHILLEAMSLIKKEYPEVKLRVAGRDITKHKATIKGIYTYSGYGKLIRRKIKKYDLQDIIVFTGPLDAQQVKTELIKANVFVSASTIENSSNSLAEAQILGVPCVASFVGGTPDMICGKESGILYRCEDAVALAYLICDWFKRSESFNNAKMSEIAHKRHDVLYNALQLITIYNQIA